MGLLAKLAKLLKLELKGGERVPSASFGRGEVEGLRKLDDTIAHKSSA